MCACIIFLTVPYVIVVLLYRLCHVCLLYYFIDCAICDCCITLLTVPCVLIVLFS
jgi:hypothetical protein